MPSAVTEGRNSTASPHTRTSLAPDPRPSMDKPYTAAKTSDDRYLNGDLSVKSRSLANGTLPMQDAPTGRAQEPRIITQDKHTSNRPPSHSTMRSRGSGMEDENAQPNGTSIDQLFEGRDDGKFAVSQQGEPDDHRLGTTKVTMEHLPNGVDGTDEPRMTESPTGLRSSVDLYVPSHRSPASYPPSDASLYTPSVGQRVSSPPTFPPPSSNASTGAGLQTPQSSVGSRLQHRHTLEVPKATTSRASRELASEDVATASGRFTPSSPTRRRGSMSMVRRGTRSIQSDMFVDEPQQDEDAARWAEHVRQKRASRRKKKEEEDDDRVVVGTKVDQHHVNWVTAYNMLTGIRFTVSRTNAKMNRDLKDDDFEARHKFSFDIAGNELTPSAKYDFKFKDYAPWVFRHLRIIFQQDPADYLMSLTSKYILSELGSPGKSGSFFYFSRDYKYIIKTIHHAEHKFLRRILRDYYEHIRENPNTLLSQFYGLHRVKMPFGRKIHFVVMNNLFPPHRDIHQTFDLKGSTIGRDFKEDDLEKNPRATLKDLNWLRRGRHLELGPTKKKAFIEQMERDVKLMQRLKIMDYSMLVGIHDLRKGNEENLREKTLQVFQPGGDEVGELQPNPLVRTPSKLENARKAKELRQMVKQQKPVPMDQTTNRMPDAEIEGKKNFYFYSDDGGFRATHEDDRPGEDIYYLGIIDCLTHYSLIKRMEHFFKGLTNQESQISAIPPERYGDRFLRFISGVTKTREAAALEKALEEQRRLEDPNSLSEGHPHTPTDIVIEKAEKVAERSKRTQSEEDVPDRRIHIVRSPSAERGEIGYSLPVVEEVGESNSTSGRSQRSIRSFVDAPTQQPTASSSSLSPPNASQSHIQQSSAHIHPPPTPPKDARDWPEDDERPPTPPKDGPPTPPKEWEQTRGRVINKDLPTIPHTNSGDLAPSLMTQDYARSPPRAKSGGVGVEEYGMKVSRVN